PGRGGRRGDGPRPDLPARGTERLHQRAGELGRRDRGAHHLDPGRRRRRRACADAHRLQRGQHEGAHAVNRHFIPTARHQGGISLVEVLVLLAAVSELGIAVLRSSAIQERLSANLRDSNLAVQTTEAALRYAQQQVLAAGDWDTAVPDATSCANQGICPAGAAASWQSMPAGTYDAQIPDPPEYWIEYLG